MTEFCDKCGSPIGQTVHRMTPHELDALSAWWHTGSVRGAAQMLHIKERTVTNHLYNARARHGLHKTTDLVQLHFGELRSPHVLMTHHNRKRSAAA